MLVELTSRDQPPDGAHIDDNDGSVDVHCQNQREKSSSEMDHLSGMVMLLHFHHHLRQTLLQREQQRLNHIHHNKLQRELILLPVGSRIGNGRLLCGKEIRVVGNCRG